MVTLFITALVVILLASAASIWQIDSVYRSTIESLRADNKDLRDRLFQSKAMSPSGVNVTEQYIERKEQEKIEPKSRRKKSTGPIEELTSKWTKSDRKLADKGVSVI